MLENDVEDQLDRSCEELKSFTESQEGEKNLQTIKRRKANWIGHILRGNCLLKQAIEGNIERRIEVTGIEERRCKQLLDDFKEKRGYYKLKEEALDDN